MTKDEFINRRTEIISRMLDDPDKYGIYPTTQCFAALDDLYDELSEHVYDPSWPQEHEKHVYDPSWAEDKEELGGSEDDR